MWRKKYSDTFDLQVVQPLGKQYGDFIKKDMLYKTVLSLQGIYSKGIRTT